MTILQKLRPSGDRHAARGWHGFRHGDQAVRHTEAWEHENFAEEQARWERSDPEYARICEQVRQARDKGEEASQRADQAKANWDARAATQRQASDDAKRAQHTATSTPPSRSSPMTLRPPGIMPEPVHVNGHPVGRTVPHSEQAARLRFRGPATVSNKPNNVEVE